MAQQVVKLIGKELGQHGPNIYYKEFSVLCNGEKRNYKLGEFYFVRKNLSQPICIAEFQLIWLNIKDGKKLALVKLYFKPEDTKTGRLSEHGEDELVEADRHVPVHCDQVPSWECIPNVNFGKYAYEGLPNTDFVTQHKDEQEQAACSCRIQNGFVEKKRAPVKVLSFPAYCRYRACMRMLSSGYNMRKELMSARGAVDVECSHTKILFCRFKFQHPGIDDFALAENVRVPVFKGRPRKRKATSMKNSINVKRTRVEKENTKPDLHLNNAESPQSSPNACSQTYRIITSPANEHSDRNVIHMKLESTNFKQENNIKANEEENNTKRERINESTNNHVSISEKYKLETEHDIKVKTKLLVRTSSSESNGSEIDNEKKQIRIRLPKREKENEEAPSELVKRGKTGTILDESTFRELKNGTGLGEGVDKEKMKKVLQDVCKDADKFKIDLYMFMKQRGTPIIYVPKVGYTRVDLQKLFQLVVSNGGYKQVTLNHKWKKIYDEMVLATTITSAATCMRRHYERLLLPFEKHLRVKHRTDAMPLKTYSVTSQVSQPLVLTIKTIKQEDQAKDTVTSSHESTAANTFAESRNRKQALTCCPVTASKVDARGFENEDRATLISHSDLEVISSGVSQSVSSAVSTSVITAASSLPSIQSPTVITVSSLKTILPATSRIVLCPRSNVLTNVTTVFDAKIVYQPLVSSSVNTPSVNAGPKDTRSVITGPAITKSTYTASNKLLLSRHPCSSETSQPSSFPNQQGLVLSASQQHSGGVKNEASQRTSHVKELNNDSGIIKSPYCVTTCVSAASNKTKSCMQSTIPISQEPCAFATVKAEQRSIQTNSNSLASDVLPVRTTISISNVQSFSVVKSEAAPLPTTNQMVRNTLQKEVSVITKANPQDEQLQTLVERSTDGSSGTSQNTTNVLKKRRGRPPKYLKNRIAEDVPKVSVNLSPNSTANKEQVISVAPTNATVISYTTTSNVWQPPTAYKPLALPASDTQQRFTDNSSRKTSKATPVKMYEYVMATDSTQAKLVKHKQGVISLPKTTAIHPTPSNLSLKLYPNVVPQNSAAERTAVGGITPSTFSVLNDFSNGHHIVTIPNPTLEKRNPFAIDHSSMNMNILNHNVRRESGKLKQDKPELPEIHSAESRTVSGKKEHCQARSVIVGPPPLVPITKPNDSKTSGSVKSTDRPSESDGNSSGFYSGNNVLLSEKGKAANGMTHISLVPDYKSMKESLDVISFMKPLSKGIDDSIEDLRRITGTNTKPNLSAASDLTYKQPYRYDPERYRYNDTCHNVTRNDNTCVPSDKLLEPLERFEPAERPKYADLHQAQAIHDGHKSQRKYDLYEKLKIGIDPYGYQYHVPLQGSKYHQIPCDDDKRTFIGNMYEDRRAIHKDHNLMHVTVDEERRSIYSHEPKRDQTEIRRRSFDDNHRPKSISNTDQLPIFHRQSSLEGCNDTNCMLSHDQQDFRPIEHSKAVYEHFHESRYHELYRASLHEQSRIPEKTHVLQSLVHGDESRLKDRPTSCHRRPSLNSQENPHHFESVYRDPVNRETLKLEEHSIEMGHHLAQFYHHDQQRLESGRKSKEFDFRYDSNHVSNLLPSYKLPSSVHDADYHHSIASVYSARNASPRFERKHSMIACQSPPPSSMHHSWYHQGTTVPNSALYWHTKVHH